MKIRDYCDTLGRSCNSTPDQVRTAYRKLVCRHQPDCAKEVGKAQSEEKTKKIDKAYEVLKEPVKRKKYDRFGEHRGQQGFAHGPHNRGPLYVLIKMQVPKPLTSEGQIHWGARVTTCAFNRRKQDD